MPDQSKYFDTLKALAWTVYASLVIAIADVLVSFVPELQAMVVEFVPATFRVFVVPVIGTVFAALQAYLSKVAQKQKRAQIEEALLMPPPQDPNDIKGLYK